ncbi:hypothetical protein BGX30_000559, partial [Mortierella sp. GBA39]
VVSVHELINTRPTIARTEKDMKGIVAGLKQIYELWIVYRDLKPENIFLSDLSAREVLLTDFGMTRYLEYDDSGREEPKGFQADEMLNKNPYNTKAGMSSLRITLKLYREDELRWGDDLVENRIRELPQYRLLAEEAEFHPFLIYGISKDSVLRHAEEGSLQVVKRDVSRIAMVPWWIATGSLPVDNAVIKNTTTPPLHRFHNSGL